MILPGDKYSIEMNPDDPPNAPQRWFKEARLLAILLGCIGDRLFALQDTGVEHDEGEDEVYCLTGTSCFAS